jgi:ubiquinone/menaquinone biosynthesis C-methylase UbiE
VETGCIGGRIEILRAPGHDNLIFADATRLPFRENYFDVITAIGLIEHLGDDQSFYTRSDDY